jgi:hypothetical protein
MKNNQLSIFTALFFAVLAFTSCNTEPSNNAELILGKWELQGATRNGNETGSLEGLFFDFSEGGTLSTNLPVSPGESPYEVKGSTITQSAGDQAIEYKIEEVSDSSMTLSTNLRNTSFQFMLKRASEQ